MHHVEVEHRVIHHTAVVAANAHTRVLAGIGEPEEAAAERVMIVLADRRARVDRLALVPEGVFRGMTPQRSENEIAKRDVIM